MTLNLNQLPNSVTGEMTYKGDFDASSGSYPTGAQNGDYYIVSVAGTVATVDYVIGDQLIYDGTNSEWDKLGGEVDLTNYYNKTEVDNKDGLKADSTTAVKINAVTAYNGTQKTHNTYKLFKFFKAMRERRVDVAAIGDSNQLQQGHGWDAGWQYGLRGIAPHYATGLIGASEGTDGQGAGNGYGGVEVRDGFTIEQGYKYDTANKTSPITPSTGTPGMPQWLADRTPNNIAGFIYVPFYLANAATGKTGRMVVYPTLFSQNDEGKFIDGMRYHGLIADFASNPGSYQHWARMDGSNSDLGYGAYSVRKNEAGDAIPGGADSLYWASFDAQPSNQYQPFLAGLHQHTGTNTTGQFFQLFQRIEAIKQSYGFSYTTWSAKGGQSTRLMAQSFLDENNAAVDTLVSSTVHLQGGEPMLMLIINEGLNDQNDTTLSVGDNPAASNTQAGFKDNHDAILKQVRASWARLGYAPDNLFFLIIPSHTISADDAALSGFRNGVIELSNENDDTAVALLQNIMPYQTMVDEVYYRNEGVDLNHLYIDGYADIGNATMKQVYTDSVQTGYDRENRISGKAIGDYSTFQTLNSSNVKQVSADYSPEPNDVFVTVDCTTANSTTNTNRIFLPEAATWIGKKITIKAKNVTTNTVTIDTLYGGTFDDGTNTQVLSSEGETVTYVTDGATIYKHQNLNSDSIGFSIDNDGSVIDVGTNAERGIERDMTITGYQIIADQTGSVTIDVLRSAYSNYPTFADITDNNKPSLSSAIKAQDNDVSDWSDVTLDKGDVLKFNVSAATTITKLQLILFVK